MRASLAGSRSVRAFLPASIFCFLPAGSYCPSGSILARFDWDHRAARLAAKRAGYVMQPPLYAANRQFADRARPAGRRGTRAGRRAATASPAPPERIGERGGEQGEDDRDYDEIYRSHLVFSGLKKVNRF